MKNFYSIIVGVLLILLINQYRGVQGNLEVTELDGENFYRTVHEIGYHLLVFNTQHQKESNEVIQSLEAISASPPTLDDKLYLHTVSCQKIEITSEIKIPKCPTVVLIRSQLKKTEEGKIIIDRKHYFFTAPTDSEGDRIFDVESIISFLQKDWKTSEQISAKSDDEREERKRQQELEQKERESLDPNYFVKENSNILSLNERNLDSVLKKRKNDIMIEFFSPSCEPCQNLAREWENLADTVKEQNHPLTIANFNCKAYPRVCNRFAIDHYPTVYLFHDTKVYDFGGQWNVKGFLDYSINKGYLKEELEYIKNLQTFLDDETDEKLYRINTDEEELDLPIDFVSQVEIIDNSNFNNLILKKKSSNDDDNLPWLLEFYAPWCGFCKKLEPTWEALALRPDRTFRVGKMDATDPNNKAIVEAFGVKGYPTIKMIMNGKVYDYTGGRTLQMFLKFMTMDHSSTHGEELSALFSNKNKEEL